MAPAVRGKVGNLPLDLTSFVGRRREVAETRRALGASRLVTLTGIGGVGKTRLALRVAADAQRSFADGVWLVEFGERRDPQLVAESVAAALGLREQSAVPTTRVLTDYLASGTCSSCWTTASTSSTTSRSSPRRCCARAPTCGSSRPAANPSRSVARWCYGCRR